MNDFSIRGFHLDLRIQVMPLEALKDFVNEMSAFGLNTLIMEWEATYPFKKHAVISNRYAYTRKEIDSFMKHCGMLGIDVIPLQQCFGHSEYILRHDRYAHLREHDRDFSQFCPQKIDQALPIFEDLFKELIETHPSPYFHLGCDETWYLGHCPACASKVKSQGKSGLYVDYVKTLCGIVTRLGKRPVIWADMLLKHPEAAAALPRETVLIDWNYGWDINHFGSVKTLLQTGLDFWGAPALRSHPDNFFLLSWEKHLNNLRDFLPHCRNAGYTGVVMTSWSTSGAYGLEGYSYTEVVELYPFRRVYPLNGCRILLAAYSKALQNADFNPASFVKDYAQERFGLSKKESVLFNEALLADPSLVNEGRTPDNRSVSEVLKSIRYAQKILCRLKPFKNKMEFEHFRLQLDLREHHLAFLEIEVGFQSEKFTDQSRPKLITILKKHLQKNSALDTRFRKLMKGFLNPSEIEEEIKARTKRENLFYARFARMR